MNDLRERANPDAHAIDERTHYNLRAVKRQPAQAFAELRQTFGVAADAIDNPNGRYSTPARIDAAELRTVPMPDLRTPQARALDAQARGLDCRTGDDKLVAEFVRLVDALQGLTLRVEVLEGMGVHFGRKCDEQAQVIAELTAYIRDHSEADE